jgi:hypothetical protein
MTSGLPPATAVDLRAGTFAAASVAGVLSLPVWLVFVGTVLLSVVRGGAEIVRVPAPVGHSERTTPVESAPGGSR